MVSQFDLFAAATAGVLVLGLSLFAKWSRLGLSLRGGRRSAGRTG
jgi:branched-chain amino acid transport system permease protein